MKRTIFFSLAIAGTISAARADGAPTGQALADQYAACWDHFNKGDWDQFTKCYGPHSQSMSAGMPATKGAKDIVEKDKKPFRTAMPDVTGEIQLMLVSGKNAATIALLHGTQTGPLPGPTGAIPPTKKRIGQLLAHAIESGPGTVAAKEWQIQDVGTMMAQLGLSQNPARPVQEKGVASPTVLVATGSSTEKANLASARKAYSLFSKHDQTIIDLMADDVVDHDQAFPADIKGKDADLAHLAGYWTFSSNLKCTTPVLFAAGDYTVAIGKIAGTNDGDMPAMGLKKTGKAFSVDFIEFTRWKDGKVAEQWPFTNSMQLAAQLMPAATHAQN